MLAERAIDQPVEKAARDGHIQAIEDEVP